MIARVPEGVPAGGQFAPGAHEEAPIVLTGEFKAPVQASHSPGLFGDRELQITQNLYRDGLIKRQKAIDDVANLALAQIAILTLRKFPDAATIRVQPSEDGPGMVVTGVHDTDGHTIASEEGYEEAQLLHEFKSLRGFAGASMDDLAAELPVQDADWWKHASEADGDEWCGTHDVDLRAAASGS
ncbi:hypothetical protein [Arthrobacter caoxuetaonis]|uniref:Uncharacterized protein n=1 Tax=Arthrobacter caoxuetaonis TaxID=2886935 RepID=A0A9X1SD42_9MICC|nr:hypothetical protein [Arthrobacter caoxuetaonis]MCC3299320.1 hypothetical protein [Arthrobacter caoxuetaonis]USQ59187.1 hypothetical protein NF551_16520 [Arthrobacter caoxuetaonis]